MIELILPLGLSGNDLHYLIDKIENKVIENFCKTNHVERDEVITGELDYDYMERSLGIRGAYKFPDWAATCMGLYFQGQVAFIDWRVGGPSVKITNKDYLQLCHYMKSNCRNAFEAYVQKDTRFKHLLHASDKRWINFLGTFHPNLVVELINKEMNVKFATFYAENNCTPAKIIEDIVVRTIKLEVD